VPITTPLMAKAGFDPVWYGILIVILMETAMVTPPVGINLFVVQGVRGRGRLHDVIIGASPFVVTLILMIAIICIFPDLVLWLPRVAK
jgi:C4-dicarboxylate transporter DctM subunit